MASEFDRLRALVFAQHELLTPGEAARQLGVTVETLNGFIERGRVRTRRVTVGNYGQRRGIDAAHVAALAEQMEGHRA